MARIKKQSPVQINTSKYQVKESFTGNINNKEYVFKKDQIVELTKGELEVFGPYVTEI